MDRPYPSCGGDFRRALVGRGLGGLLRWPEPCAADDAQRAFFVTAGCVRFSEAYEHHRSFGGGGANAWPRRVHPGAWRRLAGPCAFGRNAAEVIKQGAALSVVNAGSLWRDQADGSLLSANEKIRPRAA